jgi:hypothetical protein
MLLIVAEAAITYMIRIGALVALRTGIVAGYFSQISWLSAYTALKNRAGSAQVSA